MSCVILQIVPVSFIQYSLTDSVMVKTIAKMVPMKTAQGDFQIKKSVFESFIKDLVSDHFENHL